MSEKLRLGLLLDSYSLPAWAHWALLRIAQSQYAAFCLVILSEDERVCTRDAGGITTANMLYHAFRRLDEGFFCRGHKASERVDSSALLSDTPLIKVKPSWDGDRCFLEPSDVAMIRASNLDVLIKLGSGMISSDLLGLPRYGVWMHNHGEGSKVGPGFWEVMHGEPETISALHLLGRNGNENRVIHSVHVATFPFSPARNKNRCLWVSAGLLPRQLALLHRLGAEVFFARAGASVGQDSMPVPVEHPAPSNSAMLRLAPRLMRRNLREIWQRVSRLDTWYLMYHLGDHVPPLGQFVKVMPPKDRFWADPHIVARNGKYYVFVEEYLYKKKRGHISVIEIDSSGTWRPPVAVLEQDYHLSYPHVFAWQDSYFMVPESAAHATIDLYECTAFPYQWEFRMSLMQNIVAVDSTLFYHHDRWWLFTGIADPAQALPHVELSLFFSRELCSTEWQPHPWNPLVSDVRKARCAGSIFARGDRLYRPSQDCSRIYGFGFDLNEILMLSDKEYQERTAASVRPDWDEETQATHTFASAGRLTMVDAFMRRSRCGEAPAWLKRAAASRRAYRDPGDAPSVR